jgi:hypothetical protein
VGYDQLGTWTDQAISESASFQDPEGNVFQQAARQIGFD